MRRLADWLPDRVTWRRDGEFDGHSDQETLAYLSLAADLEDERKDYGLSPNILSVPDTRGRRRWWRG